MADFNESFSERLRLKRLEKKKLNSSWTQGFVADKVGVARSTYTAYERGTKQPPMETIIKLAEVLNVKPSYLIGEKIDFLSPAEILVKEASEKGLDIGFYNIKDWELLTEEDLEDMRKHIEWLVEKRRQMQNGED